MLKLIPAVKSLTIHEGNLNARSVRYSANNLDARIIAALRKLPFHQNGVLLTISLSMM